MPSMLLHATRRVAGAAAMREEWFMYNVFVIALLQHEVRPVDFHDGKVKVYGPRQRNLSDFYYEGTSEHERMGKCAQCQK